MRIWDVSVRLGPGTVSWKDGGPPAEQNVLSEGSGGKSRNSEWLLDSHAATHLDAPLHFLPDAGDVDAIPLDACLGECVVVRAQGSGPLGADSIPEDVVTEGARILLRSRNTELGLMHRDSFQPDFVSIGPDLASKLAAARVALVGVDYLSVESPDSDGSVHRTLLDAGIVLIEGLDLTDVDTGAYNLSALPLRLTGGEGSPCRAVLWRS